jgi:UDP-glucose 4-epimerase
LKHFNTLKHLKTLQQMPQKLSTILQSFDPESKILVVGGAGYIGSHTVWELNSQLGANKILVFDNLSYGHPEFLPSGVQVVTGDITNTSDLEAIFENHKILAVIHFAALISVGESTQSPDLYWKNNFVGSFNLLNCMHKYGVQNLVFSSTAATFGSPVYTPIDEKHPQLPINPYGDTKLSVEKLCQNYNLAFGIQSIYLRYFNACGAHPNGKTGESHNPETHLIPLILQTAQKIRPEIGIFGDDYDTPDGTCIRDYIDVLDLASAHILAITKLLENQIQIQAQGNVDSEKNNILTSNITSEDLKPITMGINLGTGKGYSVKQIIDFCEKVTGVEIPKRTHPRRQGDPSILVADNTLAKSFLDWSPKIDVQESIANQWQWMNKNS